MSTVGCGDTKSSPLRRQGERGINARWCGLAWSAADCYRTGTRRCGYHSPAPPCREPPGASLRLPTPPAPAAGDIRIPRRHPPPRRVGAVPGRISGEQPYPGCNRWEAVHWTVGISPRGVAARGEGELVPPPLSLTLQPSYFSPASPTPPAPPQGNHTLLPAPPPRPRLRRSSPAPPGGGSARAYIRGTAVSGVQPVGSRALDRGDIATGGGGSRGGGTRSPSPVSNAPTILLLAGDPHPARACGAPPPPPPGGRG